MITLHNNDIDLTNIITKLNIRDIQTKNSNPIIASSTTDKCNHHNYLEYLELAWGEHLGVVIDPKYFWHMILSEISSIVVNNPDDYRSLFTTSDEKTEIAVLTADPVTIPIHSIIDQLVNLIPTDTDLFFPTFSTSNESYKLATQIVFCETVSPYYEYSMLMCGIPSFTITGTTKDWDTLYNNAVQLLQTLQITKFNSLIDRLKILTDVDARNDINTWISMFSLDECGSGSQVEVGGWIKSFYSKIPGPGYVCNYSSHIASIEYTNLTTELKYNMYSGLFHSTLINGIVYPDYGWIVKQITK